MASEASLRGSGSLNAPIAGGVAPDFTLAMAKERYDNSKAKTLIYGLDDSKPMTPEKRKTKSLRMTPHEVPFATFEAEPLTTYPQEYVLQRPNRKTSEKIGIDRMFDPQIYMANLEANFKNQTHSRLRNFAGSGRILAHDIDDRASSQSVNEQDQADQPDQLTVNDEEQ